MSKMPVFLEIPKLPTIEVPGVVSLYNINHIKDFFTTSIGGYHQLRMRMTSGKIMCILNVDDNEQGREFVSVNKNMIENKIKLLRKEMDKDEKTIAP